MNQLSQEQMVRLTEFEKENNRKAATDLDNQFTQKRRELLHGEHGFYNQEGDNAVAGHQQTKRDLERKRAIERQEAIAHDEWHYSYNLTFRPFGSFNAKQQGAVVKLNKNFRYTGFGKTATGKLLDLFGLQGYTDEHYIVSRIPGFIREQTTLGEVLVPRHSDRSNVLLSSDIAAWGWIDAVPDESLVPIDVTLWNILEREGRKNRSALVDARSPQEIAKLKKRIAAVPFSLTLIGGRPDHIKSSLPKGKFKVEVTNHDDIAKKADAMWIAIDDTGIHFKSSENGKVIHSIEHGLPEDVLSDQIAEAIVQVVTEGIVNEESETALLSIV